MYPLSQSLCNPQNVYLNLMHPKMMQDLGHPTVVKQYHLTCTGMEDDFQHVFQTYIYKNWFDSMSSNEQGASKCSMIQVDSVDHLCHKSNLGLQ